MESIRIVLFSTVAAIAYGIVHDQVTAHLCVEYFTVWHPTVFPTTSPFLLAIGWGVIASWWVGLSLGIGLAIAARAGAPVKFGWRALRPSILKLLRSTAIAAMFGGIAGSVVASMISPTAFDLGIPPDKVVPCFADAGAHQMSYLFGTLGGLVLMVRTWRKRRRLTP